MTLGCLDAGQSGFTTNGLNGYVVKNIRVENVVADNMEVLNSPRIPIASITMTRQLKQEEAAKPAAGGAPAAKK